MALTKGVTAIWSSQTLTAGSGNLTSSAVTVDDSYENAVSVKITNGSTGPTVEAQCQIEVSHDNSEWYEFGGPMVAGDTGAGVYSWGGIVIPIGVEYVRLVAGSNTDENVTIDADITEVTDL